MRYLEWTRAPDPAQAWIETDYAFVFRHADGTVDAGHETHRSGLFARAVWVRLLAAAGFTVEVVPEVTTEERTPREAFVGHRRR